MTVEELSKVALEAWKVFCAKQKELCSYKYNEGERNVFIAGFIAGVTSVAKKK